MNEVDNFVMDDRLMGMLLIVMVIIYIVLIILKFKNTSDIVSSSADAQRLGMGLVTGLLMYLFNHVEPINTLQYIVIVSIILFSIVMTFASHIELTLKESFFQNHNISNIKEKLSEINGFYELTILKIIKTLSVSSLAALTVQALVFQKNIHLIIIISSIIGLILISISINEHSLTNSTKSP